MKTAFLTLPSPFPVEHRLIYYWPVIRWPQHDQDQSTIGPDLARSVGHILELHPGQRGLVHTVSYARAKLLLESIENDRVFGHTEGAFDSAVERLTATPASVLVSPRALEGVDLKDDLGQFAIFIKLPHLFLGDERTRRRKDLIRNWYSLQTATGLVQGAGRCVRTATDIAPTYILDAAFPNWLSLAKANRLVPEYFTDAIREFDPGL